MAKLKIYAAIHRFDRPADDGSFGVLVLDRAHGWKPNKKQREDAMKFGRQKLKDIAVACGVTGQITDLSVLLNIACSVSVKIETDDTGEYAPKNRVTRVKPLQALKPKTNGGDAASKAELNDPIPF